MNFNLFTSLLKDSSLTLAAQTAEDRKASADKAKKSILSGVIQKIGDFLAGTWTPNDLKASTSLVIDLLKNGGLPEHAELFNRFFNEKPGSFFVYSFAEIWPGLGQAEKDHVIGVYYHRAKDFVLADGVEPSVFEWACRAVLGLIELSKADTKSADEQRVLTNLAKNFADMMLMTKVGVLDAIADQNDAVIAKNATLSADERPGKTCNIEKLLYAVKETGVYKVNTTKFQSASEGAKEKGDDDRRPNNGGGQQRHYGNRLPANKFAKQVPAPATNEGSKEDVQNVSSATPPATASLGEIARQKAPSAKEMRRAAKNAGAVNGNGSGVMPPQQAEVPAEQVATQ